MILFHHLITILLNLFPFCAPYHTASILKKKGRKKEYISCFRTLLFFYYEFDCDSYFICYLCCFSHEICELYLVIILHIFQISGPLLDEGQVRSIVDEIKQVITASSSRKRERAERAKAEDFDAEESELIKEENEQEEEVFDQVSIVEYSDII